jgi:nucleotide-binding universal stress UspA family protein
MVSGWLKGPVLVATDLGTGGDEAVRQAHSFVPADGGPLHACHVLPEVLRVRALFPHLHEGDTAELLALERRTAAQVGRRLEELTGRSAAGYAVGVDTGSPHGGILRHAERLGAGLIVAGAGATATRVVRGASVPVLVARPSPAGRVLGATDFSDPSLPALRAAAGEAARRGVPLALLHSMDIPLAAYSVGLTGVPLPAVTPAIMADARTRLGDELKAFSGQPGADAECLIADGPPAKAILEAARALPAELIVVGTHGSTALTRLALGSVAEAVLSDAPCSVLVVRLAA